MSSYTIFPHLYYVLSLSYCEFKLTQRIKLPCSLWPFFFFLSYFIMAFIASLQLIWLRLSFLLHSYWTLYTNHSPTLASSVLLRLSQQEITILLGKDNAMMINHEWGTHLTKILNGVQTLKPSHKLKEEENIRATAKTKCVFYTLACTKWNIIEYFA